MRKLYYLLLVIFPSFSQSQTPLNYSGVIQIDSVSKNDLFVRARTWFNEVFTSSKDVLQINDKESGELAGKGNMITYADYKYFGKHSQAMRTYFSITLYLKDNKCKYELKNFESAFDDTHDTGKALITDESTYPGGKLPMIPKRVMDEIWVTNKANIDKKVKSIIESLSNVLNKKIADF